MNYERYRELVFALCELIKLPDAQVVLQRGSLQVEGFDVLLNNYENDPTAIYLSFDFGVVPAGRTLTVFRLMLEANLTVYAQDQAQLAVNPDSEHIVLIVRTPMTEGIDGVWLADTLTHYAEHGRYWRETILTTSDEAFEGVCSGDYRWIKV